MKIDLKYNLKLYIIYYILIYNNVYFFYLNKISAKFYRNKVF